MFDHTNLKIWQRAHGLSLQVDQALKGGARRGPPGLASQLSRACASIAANIAECAGQSSPAQSARFLDMALASSSEVLNHLARAAGTGLFREDATGAFEAELREIRRMMVAFRRWVLTKDQENHL